MINISKNLKLRIISAAVLAPIVLLILYAGGLVYQMMILVAAIVMSFEWNNIIRQEERIKLSREDHRRWEIGGIVYVALPCMALLALRHMDQGLIIIFWLFSVVWATDIAAYFAGRTIGGPKLAPAISPNKTWAGLIGGVIAAAAVGYITALLLKSENTTILSIFSGALAVVAQAGDLVESGLKRHFGVKDSGTLIPGHGGLLDRVDGVVTAAPLAFLVIAIHGGMF